jgi:hypothetical protein
VLHSEDLRDLARRESANLLVQGGNARIDEVIGMTADDSAFRQRRTRYELNALLHYGHVIPVSRALTDAYVREHHPGWTWNALMAVFNSAGIVINRGGSPPCCDPHVEVFHFDHKDSWLVEWTDGSQTERRGPADGVIHDSTQ